jgi:hypothetical protein
MSVPPKKGGRPKKAEVKSPAGYQSPATIGMIFGRVGKLDPTKFHELLADRMHRDLVADAIEKAFDAEDFAQRFNGGREEELERIGAWLAWFPEPPAYQLIYAWENGLSKRAERISKWMLLRGTEQDRKELRDTVAALPFPIMELSMRLHLRGVGDWPKLETVGDAAIILALLTCGAKTPPPEKGHYQKSQAAELGAFLLDASFSKKTAPKTKEDYARKIMKNLGFKGYCGEA